MPLSIPALDKFSVIVAQSGGLTANAGSGTGNLDVPGLTVDLPRAGTYYFTFQIVCTLDVQPTSVGVGVAYSGTVTQLQAAVNPPNGGGAVVVQTTAGTLAANTVTSTNTKWSTCIGRIDVTTSGTLKLQVSRSANTLTVAAAGIGWIREA